MKQRIAVLFGGPSNEHEVSVKTGSVVLGALDRTQYDVVPVYIGGDGLWQFMDDPGEPPLSLPPASDVLTLETAIHELFMRSIDVVFIALHGAFGEDGTIQRILDPTGIPYTGSSAAVCEVAINKPKTLAIAAEQGLTTPKRVVITRDEWKHDRVTAIDSVTTIGVPLVTKPAAGGSSIGITIVSDDSKLAEGIERALAEDTRALCEQYVAGIELTCGAIDDGTPGTTQALVPTEIRPISAPFFDYTAKYTPGASQELTPPEVSQPVIDQLQKWAVRMHDVLGCSGMSRSDFILSPDGTLYFLELNTIPGMTETSLLPQGAAAQGIPFPKLLDRIITAGSRRNRS